MRLEEIQAGAGGPGASLLRAGLSVLSLGYGAATRLRAAAYDTGLFRAHRLPVPVVSVGNLVAGGTGKTPFTAWLAARLQEDGHRPGILSRGYGPPARGRTLSDEGAVLAHLLGEDVVQIEQPDRVRGAARLLEAHPDVDVLLLDDGFQHRRVARDLDLVLVDATRPFGFGRLLPRGLLREPPACLRRADLVVLTRTERLDAAALARVGAEVARHTDAPQVRTRTVPVGVALGGTLHPPAWLEQREVLAVCGIGRPEAFFAMLEDDLGTRIRRRIVLADHAEPEAGFWARQLKDARSAEPPLEIVTTRKDAVKAPEPEALAVLEVGLEVEDDADALRTHLRGLFKA